MQTFVCRKSTSGGFLCNRYLRKTKWLLCCSYNGCGCNIDFRKENLNQGLALYPPHYKNFITIRDFNMGVNGSGFLVVPNTYDLKSLNCNWNPNRPYRIDLILANKPQSFHHSCVTVTGFLVFTI